MLVLSGKEVAQSVMDRIGLELRQRSVQRLEMPCLAVVLVGNDSASATYVASKGKACDVLGFTHRNIMLPEKTSADELYSVIRSLNEDPSVHGILVQLPLPEHLDESVVLRSIDPKKDVDGLHPTNLGNLFLGQKAPAACTPAGVLEMLDYYHIDTVGKEVVVLGRSSIVGKPMAALLVQKGRDATVTMCHSKTKNLSSVTTRADILIVAIGKPAFVSADMVKPGAVVVDVGINRVPDGSAKKGYRIIGDVDYQSVASVASAITPVPGGVGLMTIAMLMSNTLEAARTAWNET